jgi:hypothetical protein
LNGLVVVVRDGYGVDDFEFFGFWYWKFRDGD